MPAHRAFSAATLRTIFLPRPELAPFVRNVMIGGFDALEAHLPARPDAQLVIYLHGGSGLLREDGGVDWLPPAFMTGPVLAPGRFTVQPGSRFVSATFRPSGFLRCFGVPASCLGPDPVPLEDLLTKDELLPLLQRLHGARSVREMADALEALLLRKRRQRERDPPFLPALSPERLLLPARELAASLDLSTRQLERRFLLHHGLPLRDYRRLVRFSMGLAVLMRGGPGSASLAAAAHEAGYVDQPHFTRDFKQFVGETPASFLRRRLEEGSGYGFWQFDRDELDAFTD